MSLWLPIAMCAAFGLGWVFRQLLERPARKPKNPLRAIDITCTADSALPVSTRPADTPPAASRATQQTDDDSRKACRCSACRCSASRFESSARADSTTDAARTTAQVADSSSLVPLWVLLGVVIGARLGHKTTTIIYKTSRRRA